MRPDSLMGCGVLSFLIRLKQQLMPVDYCRNKGQCMLPSWKRRILHHVCQILNPSNFIHFDAIYLRFACTSLLELSQPFHSCTPCSVWLVSHKSSPTIIQAMIRSKPWQLLCALRYRHCKGTHLAICISP